MATQRYTFNAFETELSSGITAVSDIIPLVSVIGLRSPGYLVIDPEDPNLREYVGFDAISSNNLTGAASYRGLSGSVASAQAHDAGAKVRAVAMHQMWDDVWENVNQNESDIGDGQTALANHIADASDPHAAAGYATDAELQAHIDNASDPHAAAGYATEGYADTAAASAESDANTYTDDTIAALDTSHIVNSTETLGPYDQVILLNGSGTFTVTLPAAPSSFQTILFITLGLTGTVTITPNGSQNMFQLGYVGNGDIVLSTAGQSASIAWDSSVAWQVVGNDGSFTG